MMKSIPQLIKEEAKRQAETITLIASENYAWSEVLEAQSSSLSNKYSEGYAGKRYYPGNEIVDQLETRTISLAKKVFKVEHANVQALSGAQANLIIYSALLSPGDKVLALRLDHGGHLSHGHSANLSSKLYNFEYYQVNEKTGLLNLSSVRQQARDFKPKLIIAGFSAYSRDIDWKALSKIAKEVDAYLLADISHTAGLIAGGQLNGPALHADVIMTTTHKSLRGPRSAIIMCRQELAEIIDRAVFPGFQGGPHENIIAAVGICLDKVLKKEWIGYAKQVIKNAEAMAKEFTKLGYQIISDGTDNHLFVIDLTNKNMSGKEAEELLAKNNILVSRSTIPGDNRPAYNPSGIRIGTLAITSRGFKTKDAVALARLVDQAFNKKNVKTAVKALCQKFKIS